jgi:hypothetical protein
VAPGLGKQNFERRLKSNVNSHMSIQYVNQSESLSWSFSDLSAGNGVSKESTCADNMKLYTAEKFLYWKWEFSETFQGWSLWYAHSKNRKKVGVTELVSKIWQVQYASFSPMWRHLDPFTSYRNNRNCSTVIEFFNKDPTKNVYLVIMYNKTRLYLLILTFLY